MHGDHAKANEHASNQHMKRWRLPSSLLVIATTHHARARMIASHSWTHTHILHHLHTNVRLHTCAYTHTDVPLSQSLSIAEYHAEDTFNTSSPSDALLNLIA